MHDLKWIGQPAVRPTDDDGKIYEEVIERACDRLAAIYVAAELDGEATERAGRNRYRNVTMVAIRNKGETDFISLVLTPELERQFPRALAFWKQHKGNASETLIELLPGITPADVAELQDLKLRTVESLLQADVPPELQQWKDHAVRLRKPRLRLVDGEYREVA